MDLLEIRGIDWKLYVDDTKGFILLLRLRRRKKGELKTCSWTQDVIENKYKRNLVFREPTMPMKIKGLLHQTQDIYEKKAGWLKPQVENRDGGWCQDGSGFVPAAASTLGWSAPRGLHHNGSEGPATTRNTASPPS
jgi:hypothetical protein